MFWIYIIGHLNIYLRGPSCEEVGNRTSQLPTISQHHVLARNCPCNCMNVNAVCHLILSLLLNTFEWQLKTFFLNSGEYRPALLWHFCTSVAMYRFHNLLTCLVCMSSWMFSCELVTLVRRCVCLNVVCST